MSKNGICSGPYFFVFGMNTEIHSVNLCIHSSPYSIRLRQNMDPQFVLNVTVFCKIISRILTLSQSLLIKCSRTIFAENLLCTKSLPKDFVARILESLAGCRTMLLFAVFCKIGALERNAYWFHVKLIFTVIFDQSFKLDVRA